MFIGISGSICSGKAEVVKYLKLQGFQQLKVGGCTETINLNDFGNDLDIMHSFNHLANTRYFDTATDMLNYVTLHWRSDFVTTSITDLETLEVLSKRPFFLHIAVDAPLLIRWKRYQERNGPVQLEEFSRLSDEQLYSRLNGLTAVLKKAKVTIVNPSHNLELLYFRLNNLNLFDPTRLRPSWDAYFMRLADLAALRSNCMKRQVGCVLVREKRVISTGYNGTPRGLVNCNEGGCTRCNSGDGSGNGLSTCLCLHAEENALLEAGRERTGKDSTIYCNTCPCLTCSIKIVQTGVTEVVYSQSYSMDEASAKVLKAGGVVLRQYIPPSEGMIL
ncbi:hypothetical protein NADFUDRAFT_8440, partial [Nadsonia fulvescens var. elongata DSM 6958]